MRKNTDARTIENTVTPEEKREAEGWLNIRNRMFVAKVDVKRVGVLVELSNWTIGSGRSGMRTLLIEAGSRSSLYT